MDQGTIKFVVFVAAVLIFAVVFLVCATMTIVKNQGEKPETTYNYPDKSNL